MPKRGATPSGMMTFMEVSSVPARGTHRTVVVFGGNLLFGDLAGVPSSAQTIDLMLRWSAGLAFRGASGSASASLLKGHGPPLKGGMTSTDLNWAGCQVYREFLFG